MESVREESPHEIPQDDEQQQQQQGEEAQPPHQKAEVQQSRGDDSSQETRPTECDNELRPAKKDKPAEQQPIQIDQPRRISPAPSLLIITPHESAFAQMESFLLIQLEKFKFYKKVYEEQGHTSMPSKFDSFYTLTEKDIEILRKLWLEGGKLPKFKFETFRLTCTPTNVDIKDKELHIVVKTSNLPVADGATTYVVGEFEFPTTGKQESLGESAEQWLKRVQIEPKKLICCAGQSARQLDMIQSVTVKPFYDMDSKLTEYNKSLRFFVDKGRSRTLKRKFKPIKLTFYEKTSFVRFDKKIGTVQVKLDSINDDASLTMRSSIMNGRKQTEAVADIRVRVREPLVDKAIKTHEEKFLLLL